MTTYILIIGPPATGRSQIKDFIRKELFELGYDVTDPGVVDMKSIKIPKKSEHVLTIEVD